MANSWSFLHDELNMTKHSKHYYDYTRNDLNRENPFKDETSKVDGYSVNGVSNQDFWEDDGFSLTGNPYASPDTICVRSGLPGGNFSDTITFGSSSVSSGMGNDHITLGSVNLDKPSQRQWKYNENDILKELTGYITDTYNQHYSSDQIQTLDLIESCGDGEAFCRSNILKYASRYDKKGTARRDILKIMHYAVLLMYFNDKNNTTETYNQ